MRSSVRHVCVSLLGVWTITRAHSNTLLPLWYTWRHVGTIYTDILRYGHIAPRTRAPSTIIYTPSHKHPQSLERHETPKPTSSTVSPSPQNSHTMIKPHSVQPYTPGELINPNKQLLTMAPNPRLALNIQNHKASPINCILSAATPASKPRNKTKWTSEAAYGNLPALN
jgi:hypothetical protein